MKNRIRLTLILAIMVVLPVLASAPRSLSVYFGDRALDGKALWYEGEVYVPLKSVSKALDGEYSFDQVRGVARVDLSNSRAVKSRLEIPAGRAYLKTIDQRVYSTGDNLKVLATVINSGNAPATDIEVVCTFKSGYLGEINSSVANLTELLPGQRKTLEFWLYEQRLPDVTGGRPYAQPMMVPGSFQPRTGQHVYLNGSWERVTYNFSFDFHSPSDTF